VSCLAAIANYEEIRQLTVRTIVLLLLASLKRTRNEGEWKKVGDRNDKRTGILSAQKNIGLKKDYITIELWSECRIPSLPNWHNDNARMQTLP
jgi:hypothetical protein